MDDGATPPGSEPAAAVEAPCTSPSWREEDRLAALARYAILDTGREGSFDEVAAIAADLLDAPMAVVNLIAADRQWFKAEVGIGTDSLPLDVSICRHAILQPGVMVVPDLQLDPRFEGNPLIHVAGGLRFYAGALLATPDGLPLGTVCVLGREPRPQGITPRQERMLRALAAQVMALLEARRATAEAEAATRHRTFLLKLEERLRDEADPAALMDAAIEFLGQHLGAAQVGFGEVDDAKGCVTVHRDWNDGRIPSVAGTWRMDDFGPALTADLRLGRTVAIPEIMQDPRTKAPDVVEAYAAIQTRAILEVSLVKADRLRAILFVHQPEPRVWTSEEVALVDSTAERLWSAVERARAATALAESEERLRLATEHAEIGFWDVEDGHGMLIWPPRVKAMFGISPDQPVTMDDFYAGLHPHDRSRVAEVYAAAADPGRRALYDTEYRAIGKEDGLTRWVAAKGRGVFDGEGPQARCLRVIGTAIDVTTRKQAESALTESEARFRNMADHAPVMMWTTEPNGACTYLNRGWYEFTGQSEQEALGLGWLEATHPEDRARAERIFLDANERQAPFRLEYRLRRADGVYRWAIDAAAPRFGPGAEFLGYIGSVIDITERREVEEALQDSEVALRELNATLERQVSERTEERDRIWRLSRDLMCVARLDGTLLSANPAWERVLGWSPEWLAGRNAAEIKHPDDAERTVAELSRLAAGHPTVSFEDRYRHKDGSWRWIAWAIEPEGPLIYCIGRDITAEKARQAELQAAEAARREADALYRAYFENTAEALFVIGVLPDGGFTVEDLNPAHQSAIGFRLADVAGKRLDEVLPPQMVERVMMHYRRVLASGEVYQYRESFVVQGNTTHWDTVLVPVRGSDGQIIRIIGSSRDLTSQVAAEEALRQSQKMEAVGQLTGGLAHDFNNLLAAISGSLELMATRMAQGRHLDVDRYMAAAQGAARRAASLTHRLLAFSRRQTLAPKVTDVNALVSGMEDLINRTIGPEIVMETIADSGVWPVEVDPNQLENALLNLAINARDAMPDGGRLTIETANRWLDARIAREQEMSPGQYVSLSVSDTGTGMAPEVMARAFDPFFTTKPLGVGTGLGLSMVYGFARQSGGQVRIHSEPGQGTQVSLYLPRHLGEAADSEAGDADTQMLAAGQAGQTVLVIDDEPVVRMLIVDVLEELGYATLEASDGPEGLRLLQSKARVDLLVTDVGLPGGLNGRQVADAARVLRPNLKVLFITGYAENAAMNHNDLEAGMQVVTKPFQVEELRRRIGTILAGG